MRLRRQIKAKVTLNNLGDLGALPVEILLQIMTKLPIYDLISLSLGNRILHQIAGDNTLWTPLLIQQFPDVFVDIRRENNASIQNYRKEFLNRIQSHTPSEKFKHLFFYLNSETEEDFAKLVTLIKSCNRDELESLIETVLPWARKHNKQRFLDEVFWQSQFLHAQSIHNHCPSKIKRNNRFHWAAYCNQDSWVNSERSTRKTTITNLPTGESIRVSYYPAGSEIDRKNGKKQTALQIACTFGLVNVAVGLINRGADPNKRVSDVKKNGSLKNKSYLHVAAENGQADIINTLCENRDVRNRINSCVFWDSEDPYSKESDTDSIDFNALHFAVRAQHVKAAEALLTMGANANANGRYVYRKNFLQTTSRSAWKPLHLAADAGHDELIGLLLRFNADINAVSNCGLRAIDLAAKNNHVSSIELLLAASPFPQLDKKSLRNDNKEKHLSCEFYFRKGMTYFDESYSAEDKKSPSLFFKSFYSNHKFKFFQNLKKAHECNPLFFTKRLVKLALHNETPEKTEAYRNWLLDIYKENLKNMLTKYNVTELGLSIQEQKDFEDYMIQLVPTRSHAVQQAV